MDADERSSVDTASMVAMAGDAHCRRKLGSRRNKGGVWKHDTRWMSIRGLEDMEIRLFSSFCLTKQIMIQKKPGIQLPAEDPSTHHKKP